MDQLKKAAKFILCASSRAMIRLILILFFKNRSTQMLKRTHVEFASTKEQLKSTIVSELDSKFQTLILNFFSFLFSRFSCTSHSFLARLSASLSANASVVFSCSILIDRFMKLSSSSSRCFSDADCCSVKNSASILLRKTSYFNSETS